MTGLLANGLSEGVFALLGAIIGGAIGVFGTLYQTSRSRRDKRRDEVTELLARFAASCFCLQILIHNQDGVKDHQKFMQLLHDITLIGGQLRFMLHPKFPLEAALSEQVAKVMSTAFDKTETIGAALTELEERFKEFAITLR